MNKIYTSPVGCLVEFETYRQLETYLNDVRYQGGINTVRCTCSCRTKRTGAWRLTCGRHSGAFDELLSRSASFRSCSNSSASRIARKCTHAHLERALRRVRNIANTRAFGARVLV